jgi:hypothetical protein
MVDTFGFVDAIAPTPASKLRRRMGTITAYGSNHTISVQVAGDTTTTITGVRYFGSFMPQVGSQVWLDTDGQDIIAVGSIAGLGAPVPICKVYRNAAVNIATATTYTTVTWDAQTFDSHDMWTSGTNVVAPITGTYLVNATFGFAANSAGYRTGYIACAGNVFGLSQIDGLGTQVTSLPITGIAKATAGDAFTMSVRQTSGVALALYAGADYATSMTVTYLGPHA